MISKDFTIKICDFGLAKTLDTLRTVSGTYGIGTPMYLAPELWNDLPYSYKVDVWSVGVTIYQLVEKDFPFKANNQGALMNKILNQPHIPISSKSYSKDLIKNIDLLLSKDPKLRPSFDEALDLIPKDILK